MKKFWPYLIILLLAAAVAVLLFCRVDKGYVPTLRVVGDVAQCLELNDMDDLGKIETVTSYDEKYRAVSLSGILEQARPLAQVSRVLFVTDDGFTACLSQEGLSDCWLSFSSEDGWCSVAPNHPISANAKHIQRLIVVCDEADAITIEDASGSRGVSLGRLYAETHMVLLYDEGIAQKDNGDSVYESHIYTFRDCVSPEMLLGEEFQAARLTATDGTALFIRKGDDYLFQLQGNSLNCINGETRSQLADIVKIKCFYGSGD